MLLRKASKKDNVQQMKQALKLVQQVLCIEIKQKIPLKTRYNVQRKQLKETSLMDLERKLRKVAQQEVSLATLIKLNYPYNNKATQLRLAPT
jgi:hypothetical protein